MIIQESILSQKPNSGGASDKKLSLAAPAGITGRARVRKSSRPHPPARSKDACSSSCGVLNIAVMHNVTQYVVIYNKICGFAQIVVDFYVCFM